MSVLDSGLETIDYSTPGWSAIVSSNMELLDSKLEIVMTSAKTLGEEIHASESNPNAGTPSTITGTTLTDSTGGTASQTVGVISGSGADTGINDNFASNTDEINKLVADVTNIKTVLDSVVTLLNSLKDGHNGLLVKLRDTTGNGVLKA